MGYPISKFLLPIQADSLYRLYVVQPLCHLQLSRLFPLGTLPHLIPRHWIVCPIKPLIWLHLHRSSPGLILPPSQASGVCHSHHLHVTMRTVHLLCSHRLPVTMQAVHPLSSQHPLLMMQVLCPPYSLPNLVAHPSQLINFLRHHHWSAYHHRFTIAISTCLHLLLIMSRIPCIELMRSPFNQSSNPTAVDWRFDGQKGDHRASWSYQRRVPIVMKTLCLKGIR